MPRRDAANHCSVLFCLGFDDAVKLVVTQTSTLKYPGKSQKEAVIKICHATHR